MNFSSGTFGNPNEYPTLILFWQKMEELHYPGAGDTRKWLEERAAQEEARQQALMQQQMLLQQNINAPQGSAV
jgi:hypothetical protein